MVQTIFIGRKTELQRLEDSLKRAEGGQLQVIFIAGEAGAGKTALVEEFIRLREDAVPNSLPPSASVMRRPALAIHIFPFARY
jgi:ATP-dependent Clp protease ATP-binding subunit ClpA